VLREHGQAIRIVLNLPGDLESCPLESEIEAADTGEERADPHIGGA
jgi:hypothetical protein